MKCEICNTSNIKLDNHHIQSKSYNGNNKKYNKTILCPNCHRKVHSGDIIIEGRFMTSSGYKLIYRYKNDDSVTDYNPNVWIY